MLSGRRLQLQILRDRYFQDTSDLFTMLTQKCTQEMGTAGAASEASALQGCHAAHNPTLHCAKGESALGRSYIDKFETLRQIVKIMEVFTRRKPVRKGSMDRRLSQGKQLKQGCRARKHSQDSCNRLSRLSNSSQACQGNSHQSCKCSNRSSCCNQAARQNLFNSSNRCFLKCSCKRNRGTRHNWRSSSNLVVKPQHLHFRPPALRLCK